MAQRLVKCFLMDERIRSRLIFSDSTKIRLSPEGSQLQLKSQGIHKPTGETLYPTDTDLTVTITPTNPTALTSWVGFDVEPRPTEQPDNTTVQFKLNDGTDDRYWDGGAWAVAGATDWNDQATIAANISTFASETSSQQLGIVINLATTDKFATPTIKYIDLLMDCGIDYIRSLVADALVPSLRSSITPRIDYVLYADGGTVLSLQDLETAYNISSVNAAYNHTDDPNHLTNIASSYDSSVKLLTLTTSVERGKKIWVEFEVEPEVYVNYGNQDYTEVEKIPSVVIDSFTVSGNEIAATACVRDINNNEASVRRAPFRLALDFEVLLLAEKNRTLLGMMDKALEHINTNRLLSWPACDEQVSLRSIDEGIFTPRPELTDRHQARYSLRFEDVFLWLRPEETVPLIQTTNFDLSAPDLEGGSRYTGKVSGIPC